MPEDFSRVRDNPLLNYSGVELKQGGVLLDADANELVALLDRRLRAVASDVLGRATVSATTPEAFKITPSAGGFTIGQGRLYVDGLLAENHGAGSNTFDPLMAEPSFAGPISYTEQPYLPGVPPLPQSGKHIVYLDVWQREVTHLEDPTLVEVAVGVETSSRRQTVWQVKVLKTAQRRGDNLTCDTDLDEWNALIARSTGRLTTGTFEGAAVEDPCELPPTGGYRGLENRLYRIEIHDSGKAGAATFKWSAYNASIGSRVTSVISDTELELATLGRDEVLRVSTGDWVEILDDEREFAQEPGEMRQISIDEDSRRITFKQPLLLVPAGMSFPDTAFPVARNLRVRRWDQKHKIHKTQSVGSTIEVQDLDETGSNGVITVPADPNTTLLLENGITVKFDSVGDNGFRVGDYWVVAARTSDASVELLKEAPPRGIHHHYARLAVWTAGRQNDVTDCRDQWPPAIGDGHDCSCTVCVTPESHKDGTLTIQGAVDKVKSTGGAVCLGPGAYPIAKRIEIVGAKGVRIEGHGPATTIQADAGEVFFVAKSVGVVICNLGMLSPNRGTAISVQTVGGLTLEKLNILKEVGDEDIVAAAIELSGTVVLASIRNNIIVSPAGIRSVKTAGERGADVPRWLMAMAIEISNNFFQCSQSGIALGEGVAHTNGMRIQNNEFLSCKNVAISLSGYALARIGDLGAPVPTAQVLITGNTVSVGGSGIECAVDGVNISDNKLARHGSTGARADLNGIKLMRGLDPSGMDQCQVLANQIDGFSGTGILIQAKIRDLLVKLNVIQECGNGILADSGEQLDAVSIENNHVRDVATTRTSVGIGVFGAASAAIVGNTIKGVGLESASAVGILVRGVAHSRIAGNDVIDVGPKGEVGNGSGISVGAPFDDVQLANNYVTPSATRAGAWLALSVSESSRIERTDEVMVVRGETNSVVIARGRARFVRGSQDSEGGRKGANVSVLGNAFRSPGSQPMAELSAGGHIIFANNHCEPVGGISAARGVLIAADTVVVSSNHVLGGKSSILLEVAQKRMTVLGNITLTPILLESGDLPESWKPLNVVL